MPERKIIHEVKLSKPILTVAIVAAAGLLLIGLRPIIETTPAFANSGKPTKISICSESGRACAMIFKNLVGESRLGVTR